MFVLRALEKLKGFLKKNITLFLKSISTNSINLNNCGLYRVIFRSKHIFDPKFFTV